MAVHVRDVAKMVEVIAHSVQELAGSMYRQLLLTQLILS